MLIILSLDKEYSARINFTRAEVEYIWQCFKNSNLDIEFQMTFIYLYR